MILADQSIRKYIQEKKIVIDPFDEKSIQPSSLDLKLGKQFLLLEDSKMEMISMEHDVEYREITADTIMIPPRSFLLATTEEIIKIPNDITAFVEGRSSIGRIGLFIQNAGYIDPGFEGKITLELFNASSLPIKLIAGRRICQLVFSSMDCPSEKPYSGKYQGQNKTTGSRINLDNELTQ